MFVLINIIFIVGKTLLQTYITMHFIFVMNHKNVQFYEYGFPLMKFKDV